MIPSVLQVLLVDDSEDDNYFSQRAIQKSGVPADVTICVDGLDAIHYLGSNDAYAGNPLPAPDLIFLDINMPRMTGWEFIDAFGELPIAQNTTTIVVMLTTSGDDRDKERALTINELSTYLVKPLTSEQMASIAAERFGFGKKEPS